MKKAPVLSNEQKSSQIRADADANERGENEGMATVRPKRRAPAKGTNENGRSAHTTDQLERRVLAHEQILQALIAHMTESEPKFLERLTDRFSYAISVAHEEHDFIETIGYAERFVREVTRLVEVEKSPKSPKAPAPYLSQLPGTKRTAKALDYKPSTSLYRIKKLNGIWHVTKDGRFFGDFYTLGEATGRAQSEVTAILKDGGLAALVYG